MRAKLPDDLLKNDKINLYLDLTAFNGNGTKTSHTISKELTRQELINTLGSLFNEYCNFIAYEELASGYEDAAKEMTQ